MARSYSYTAARDPLAADQLPELRTRVPGPRSRELAARLARVESRNVTCLAPEPIFWERARGANVWDVDGNRYVDLGAAFGVANVGHAHPRVVRAVASRPTRCCTGWATCTLRGQGRAARGARAPLPGRRPARAVLGSSGSDAVEIALKTARSRPARGRSRVRGRLSRARARRARRDHREAFRAPFAARLAARDRVRALRRRRTTCGARGRAACAGRRGVVEPIQGRGGERVPPAGFLAALRRLCDARGMALIADEIYTGFGRTGAWFACEHEGVQPDLLCIGKGLASGMPISACIGRAEVMDAWPVSHGEALHTQTFLGHPPACAAALASLAVLEEEKLVARAAEIGARATRAAARRHRRRRLGRRGARARPAARRGVRRTRGGADRARGPARARRDRAAVRDDGRVIALSPPLSIDGDVLDFALDALAEELR
jgi:4-aminobutyrate aminotransferase/(S)-3-amino-2-methylpropionate transaminase